MNFLTSDRIRDHVQELIYEDTQLHERKVDLTLDKVSRFSRSGSLDFGGSEFEPASLQPIDPKKETDDDQYGWWRLKPGQYKAAFNEKINLEEDIMAVLALHDHARQAGIIANTVLLMSGDDVSLSFKVPDAGCDIKENARVATASLIQV